MPSLRKDVVHLTDLSGPDRVRLAIARDRGHYAPARPVQLCGQPDPQAGALYLPAELLPPDQRAADALVDDLRRSLQLPVHVTYRADWSRPLPSVNRLRRLGNWLVSPLARLLGF